jgi:hypothetical protein
MLPHLSFKATLRFVVRWSTLLIEIKGIFWIIWTDRLTDNVERITLR